VVATLALLVRQRHGRGRSFRLRTPGSSPTRPAPARDDRQTLNRKLDAYRRGSGNTVAVLVVSALDGEPIEDVAYDTFRAWGIGKKAGTAASCS